MIRLNSSIGTVYQVCAFSTPSCNLHQFSYLLIFSICSLTEGTYRKVLKGMTNDPLLKPYTLKNLTLPNRLVSTSHAAAYAIDGMPQERYLRYHLEKAKGGVGLTMMGGASCVSPESPAFVNNIALYRDEVVGHLKRLTDAV